LYPVPQRPEKELPPREERRYVVAYNTTTDNREVIVVFDKLNQKITYKVNAPTRHAPNGYPYIEKYYGKANCVALGKKDLRIFE
jgi:hypothetical protein